tara:strand:+ start:93 stop:461 length:369 start_codon:yes stop_codon:yes gene_type:complete
MISALENLDIDASWYFNQYYFPSKKSKEWKNLLNDQYKYHLKNFIKTYDNDINKRRVEQDFTEDGRLYLINMNFLGYIKYHHKDGPKKWKRTRYFNKTKGHLRAIEYRKESRKIRRITNLYE